MKACGRTVSRESFLFRAIIILVSLFELRSNRETDTPTYRTWTLPTFYSDYDRLWKMVGQLFLTWRPAGSEQNYQSQLQAKIMQQFPSLDNNWGNKELRTLDIFKCEFFQWKTLLFESFVFVIILFLLKKFEPDGHATHLFLCFISFPIIIICPHQYFHTLYVNTGAFQHLKEPTGWLRVDS